MVRTRSCPGWTTLPVTPRTTNTLRYLDCISCRTSQPLRTMTSTAALTHLPPLFFIPPRSPRPPVSVPSFACSILRFPQIITLSSNPYVSWLPSHVATSGLMFPYCALRDTFHVLLRLYLGFPPCVVYPATTTPLRYILEIVCTSLSDACRRHMMMSCEYMRLCFASLPGLEVIIGKRCFENIMGSRFHAFMRHGIHRPCMNSSGPI